MFVRILICAWCLVFCVGSYPHASQFYYDTNQRGRSDSAAVHEIYVDEIGLINGGKPEVLGKQLRQSITALTSFNLFDEGHPHLHVHLPQGDEESNADGVMNPIHETPSVRQAIDPRNKPTDFNKAKPAAKGSKAFKASKSSGKGNSSLPPPPQKPLYQPVVTLVQDTNQDDDEDDIDDSDRYHRHAVNTVDASSLVLPAANSSPGK